MRISLIVAVAENGVIGRDGTLPWRLSADLRRFKKTTMGHTMIMGRKTYESIGRPLPGRTSVVVTRQQDYQAPGCHVVHDWNEALLVARGADEVYVIGGQQIYQLALPSAARLHWTRVHAAVTGEAAFPEVSWDDWRLVSEERHEADAKNEFACTFCIYERVALPGSTSPHG